MISLAASRSGLALTLWKRSSPYPSFMNFDATARAACTVRRSRSNTPLQALTLLNDPVYVDAARGLARRVLTERPGASTADRIRHAFQLCVAPLRIAGGTGSPVNPIATF